MPRHVAILSAVGTLAMSACADVKPFDRARCQLEMQTRLESGIAQEGLIAGKDYYFVLIFDEARGDADLLSKYLHQKGYSEAASDPNDVSSRHLGYYFPNKDPEANLPVADQSAAPKVACEASFLSGARLKSVSLRSPSSGQPIFEAELNK